jgi:hypothetical protein
MSAGASCPRLFEAEAMRDGRLGHAERASFEKHVRSCAACAREVRALDTLGERLRTTAGESADELCTRRERTRLLAAFDRALVAPEGRPGSSNVQRWWIRATGVAAVAAAVITLLPLRGRETPAARRPEIHADAEAAWSEHVEADGERVVLERGTLSIHVDHASAPGRFAVVLPDGELEDIGTTFAVRVEAGHTTRVAVVEGRVVLRMRGQAPVAVDQGETWVPPTIAAPVASAPALLAVPEASAPALLGDPAFSSPSPTSAAPAITTSSGTQTLSPASPMRSAIAVPAPEFRAAMSAFDAGDWHDAAALFAAFGAKHPTDPRAEDAAYLRVIALQRCSDDRARQAAREYLTRFPAGFRRAEVGTMAQ